MKYSILVAVTLVPLLSLADLININGTFRGRTLKGEDCYVRYSSRNNVLAAGYQPAGQPWVAFATPLSNSERAAEGEDVLRLNGWAEHTRFRLRLKVNNLVVIKNIEAAEIKIGVFSGERSCVNMYRTLD
ncbi:MAG: hypothetical protein ACK5Y2_12710 [Bdellovibrionales bacterium]